MDEDTVELKKTARDWKAEAGRRTGANGTRQLRTIAWLDSKGRLLLGAGTKQIDS
jgi:hypothetical protein